MRISPARVALVTAVFIAALVGALLLLRGGDSGTSASDRPDGGDAPAAAATSDVWKVGDAWVVKVRQDAGAITPDGETSIATIPFRFEVLSAPTGSDEAWVVHVEQEGAEGPFAAGWKLQYVDRDGVMELHRVAVGSEPPLEAELASIVLGPQFPYEARYESAPRDATLDAEDLLERSTLPPSSMPGRADDAPGAAPPEEAPKLEPGGAPKARS